MTNVYHTSFADFNAWFAKILPYIAHAEIIQQYTNDNCTCCIVNLNVGDQAAILRVVELVTFENNKISEIKWIYDPRDVLDYLICKTSLIVSGCGCVDQDVGSRLGGMPHGRSPAGAVYDIWTRREPVHGGSGATSLLLTVLMSWALPTGSAPRLVVVFYDKL